ncbi:MAG: type I DNA topoisomerase [Bdellovibrionota bacterium]
MAGSSLVIVESPTKAKTLKKYMGRGYEVLASVGHVIDLPKSKLGVDVEKDFEPSYVVIKGKADVLKDLKKAAKGVEKVLLATDPDREGEAIAWHIAEALRTINKNVERVEFHEITKKAVQEAIKHPRALNKDLFEAQQARRVLDRLVGYKLSPLLWNKVRRGLSAGRVQSVALRLIVEREREIKAFVPQEYWSIATELEGKDPPPFLANLWRVNGEKVEIGNQEGADKIKNLLDVSTYKVSKVERKERRRNAPAPFTTSLLQQEGARKLRFPAKKTMMLAQRLYEGQEIGEEGLVGLITYMRTDAVRLADEAIVAAREYIGKQYGKDYLPEQPNTFKARKGAQEAHEAIRPTSTEHTPEKVKPFLERDMFRLYQLIWQRYIACQMTPAVYDQTSVDVEASPKGSQEKITLRATGSILKFKGFTAVYTEGHDEGDSLDEGEEGDRRLPVLTEGQDVQMRKVIPEQHFTAPPPRYTEASLVKALEEQGIGRPSTYAAILSNIQDKKYAVKEENRFFSTEMGALVTDLLVEHFPSVMDIQFTAKMEDELDEIADGKRPWVTALQEFYGPFRDSLDKAAVHMRDVKGQAIETEFVCEKCGSKMVLKWGRFGEFLACPKYPDCKNTMNIKRKEDGSITPVRPQDSWEPYEGSCTACGSTLTVRRAWTGSRYIACEKYKNGCTVTRPFPIGIKCPECSGDIVERASKRRKLFYGCGRFPDCKYVVWNKPVAKACPSCNHPFLTEKFTKRAGHQLVCPKEGCGYKETIAGPEELEESAEEVSQAAGAES